MDQNKGNSHILLDEKDMPEKTSPEQAVTHEDAGEKGKLEDKKPQTIEEGIARLSDIAEKWIKLERRRAAWRNLMVFAIAAYFLFLTMVGLFGFNLFNEKADKDAKFVAVVNLQGAIMPGTDTSSETMLPVLDGAFREKNSVGVLLRMNSPGGSPVQSSILNKEIQRLKKKYNKKVVAVIEDVCASGCYYVAVAADKIYADENSIVGSIGVRSDIFGFTGLMNKLGVENRSMYAGEHKAFINPFGEKDEEGREHFKKHTLEKVHQQFIKTVKEGRKGKLDTSTPGLFTGLVWAGQESAKIGLIDGVAYASEILDQEFKTEKVRVFSPRKNWIKSILEKGAKAAISGGVKAALSDIATDQAAGQLQVKAW